MTLTHQTVHAKAGNRPREAGDSMQTAGPIAGVPAFVAPPADPDLVKRITKLAEYCTRNGPAFELMLKEKQKENAEYAFLFAGEGADFYAWCLFCMHRRLPFDQPLPEEFVDAAPAPAAAVAGPVFAVPAQPVPMPDEVVSGFTTVLDMLTGSQESIKASSAWFLACSLHAGGMADMVINRILASPDFQSQLHLLYLMNDIFFVGPREGQPVDARLTGAFVAGIGPAMAAAWKAAAYVPDACHQMMALLDLWLARGIFDGRTVDAIRAAVLAQGPVMHGSGLPMGSGAPPGAAMPPATTGMGAPEYHSGFGGGHVPNWGQGPGPGHSHGGPDPGGWPHTMQPPADAYARQGPYGGFNAPGSGFVAGPAPHWNDPTLLPPANSFPTGPSLGPRSGPELEPYDICSFPAGLLPKLLRRHLRYEEAYTPLAPEDIDREPPPRVPDKTPYLTSRLQSFQAEIAQYRPGVSRHDFEKKRQAEEGIVEAEPKDLRQMKQEGGMLMDGSYGGGPELERGGLGSHQAATSNANPEDQFAHYRRQRSGRYHETMAAKSTNPNRPPLGH